MSPQSTRRFPPPWTVEQIPGGYKVKDANGQSLAYIAVHRVSMDEPQHGHSIRQHGCRASCSRTEARRIASNIAELPNVLRC